jgi:4-hydroxy-tetrahydrodipicolinate reductase
MSGPLRVLLIGATGRMGQALVRVSKERPNVRITGAVTHAGSVHQGRDVGEVAGVGRLGVTVTADVAAALRDCDCAIDFSQSPATASNLAACMVAGKPLLVGTTGLAPELKPEIERAARHIALLIAANTSLGVTLLVELVRQAAQTLPLNFDIEIIEAHHRLKKDAPSGTALALGHAAAQARGQELDEVSALERRGLRREGDIVRGGDIVGDHTVVFAATGEQVVLSHRATDRNVFARGALDAAAWLAAQTPGHYFMRDIIL